MTKTELLFDIESTGLLRQGSTIHCIVMRDMSNVEEAEVFDYKPERAVIQGVKALERADTLIGHNILGYDIPLLKEQYPDFEPRGEVLDTLVLSRLYYPRIVDRDYERRPSRNASTTLRQAFARSLGLQTEVLSRVTTARVPMYGIPTHLRCLITAFRTPLVTVKLYELLLTENE